MIERSAHDCAEVRKAFDHVPYPPVFGEQAVRNILTGKDEQAVFLYTAGTYSYQTIQVYFCPWCGEKLAPSRTDGEKYVRELAEYHEYRKRHVKSGQTRPPFTFSGWQQASNEFDEIDFLLRFAKPEHAEGLFRRKQVLRDRLALGVIIRDEPLPETAAELMEGMEPMM